MCLRCLLLFASALLCQSALPLLFGLACLLQLFGYQLVNLAGQGGLFLLLLHDELLHRLLLALQLGHHALLLGLAGYQPLLLGFTFRQQSTHVAAGLVQFVNLLPHLFALLLHGLALCPLVDSVFTDKAQTTVHLGEVMGTEDEHQTVLEIPVPVHVAQRVHEALLTGVEFLFQYLDVLVQFVDVALQFTDIISDGVNGLALVVDLVIDHHQVLESLLDVALVFHEFPFLLLDILLNSLAFVLQALHRDCWLLGRLFLSTPSIPIILSLLSFLSTPSFLGTLIFLGNSGFGGGYFPLGRRVFLLLSRNNHHHAQTE